MKKHFNDQPIAEPPNKGGNDRYDKYPVVHLIKGLQRKQKTCRIQNLVWAQG